MGSQSAIVVNNCAAALLLTLNTLSDNKEVIKSDPLIDAQFLPWLESKNEDYQFQRVDSEINELDDKESKEIVDKDGKSNTENLKETIVKALNKKFHIFVNSNISITNFSHVKFNFIKNEIEHSLVKFFIS